ncbi:farnesyl pyrophosphate synthase-like [Sitodiplosis mosellana]|uniref:farnesyl pyrophosphate synthase-like n=1 Tax=Sitodiplosis mosellana TaxID=263140 RepID=UPI0024450815|nr:farnesyl pyrophosphate synthase-like [Sitodiplosis mosellana]
MFRKLVKLTAVRSVSVKNLREKSSIRFSSAGVNQLNTLEQHNSSPLNYSTPFSSDLTTELRRENAQFMRVFPDLIRDLTEFSSKHYELRDAANHFAKALEYNVPHGKKVRGLTAVIVYKDLIGKEHLTPENMRNGHILGWCVELLQSVFLMSDDIIDRSQIRRNRLCWYKLDDVQSIAVNDILMIENGCYFILKRFFSHLSCYTNMFELFHETAMNTFVGQSLDFQIANDGIEHFSMDKHISMSNHKTSHFAFYTPIALPMLLAGYENAKIFGDIKTICYELGHFYQSQNDFLDCFSESGVLKKPGTDIEDGKCTWLAVTAMEHASDEQKAILKKCYAKNDPECIDQVKQIYNDLELSEVYSQYEENTYNRIKKKIKQFSHVHKLPHQFLLKTLNRTFNRS